MITVENVTKQYRAGRVALDDVSVAFAPGVVGLLGPNGAGKTTLMRIIAALLLPTTGRVLFEGHSVHEDAGRARLLAALGYLPQTTGFHPELSVAQNLDYFALLKTITDRGARQRVIEQALALAGLADARHERAGRLSGGMQRRLGIGITLLSDPRVIIVDEPTAGLDPQERIRLRNILAQLGGQRLVILSTHIVEDVASIAQTLLVLHHGKRLFHGTVNGLIAPLHGRVWAVPVGELGAAGIALADNLPQLVIEGGAYVQGVFDQPPSATARPVTPTLEDAYLAKLGRG